MRQQHSNGRVRSSRDPDRRPSFRQPAFRPLPTDHPLTVCGRCCAAIPASERAQQGHRRFHEQVDSHDAR